MTSPNTVERKALVERMDLAMADASVNGKESSEYFLDKCDAEAGRASCEASEIKPAQSPWKILFSGTWIGRLIWH